MYHNVSILSHYHPLKDQRWFLLIKELNWFNSNHWRLNEHNLFVIEFFFLYDIEGGGGVTGFKPISSISYKLISNLIFLNNILNIENLIYF